MTNSLYRRLARLLAVIAISVPILGGCGQKGPLYLPGNPSEIQTEVPKQDSGRETVRESGRETVRESERETGQELPAAEPQDEEDDETLEVQP